MTDKADIAATRELLERAVKTLRAVPDPDARFLRTKSGMWPEMLQSVHEAYGYAPPRVRTFRPTPRDVSVYLEVLDWLGWLSTQTNGERDVKIIVAVAMGSPFFALGQRYGRSDRTLVRWHENAIASLYRRFRSEVNELRFDTLAKTA